MEHHQWQMEHAFDRLQAFHTQDFQVVSENFCPLLNSLPRGGHDNHKAHIEHERQIKGKSPQRI